MRSVTLLHQDSRSPCCSLGQGFLIKTFQWLTTSQHLPTSAPFIFSCLPPGGGPKKQWVQVLLLKVCPQKLGSSPPVYTCSGGIGCSSVWHFQCTSFFQWGRGNCLDLSSSHDTVIFWETQHAGRPGQEEDRACEHVDLCLPTLLPIYYLVLKVCLPQFNPVQHSQGR